MSDDEKIEWESVSVTPEEVKKILDEREGGRYAGRGDSPWTQKRYEKEYGIERKVDDWILSPILEDPFYNFRWFVDCGERKMKPLVRNYSLPRELTIKAAETVMCSFVYGTELLEHKKRIKYIVSRAIEEGLDKKYGKEPLCVADVRFPPEVYRKCYRQARTRFFNRLERREELDDRGEENYVERLMARDTAFEAAYLCLRAEDPEEAYYVLWGLTDQYDMWTRQQAERFERLLEE